MTGVDFRRVSLVGRGISRWDVWLCGLVLVWNEFDMDIRLGD